MTKALRLFGDLVAKDHLSSRAGKEENGVRLQGCSAALHLLEILMQFGNITKAEFDLFAFPEGKTETQSRHQDDR